MLEVCANPAMGKPDVGGSATRSSFLGLGRRMTQHPRWMKMTPAGGPQFLFMDFIVGFYDDLSGWYK